MKKSSDTKRYGTLVESKNGTFIAYADEHDSFENATPIAYGEEQDVDDL